MRNAAQGYSSRRVRRGSVVHACSSARIRGSIAKEHKKQWTAEDDERRYRTSVKSMWIKQRGWRSSCFYKIRQNLLKVFNSIPSSVKCKVFFSKVLYTKLYWKLLSNYIAIPIFQFMEKWSSGFILGSILNFQTALTYLHLISQRFIRYIRH